MRRFSLFCAIAASLLLVQSARAVHVISVLDGSFEPDYVFINAGDTVQWQFDGNLPHSGRISALPRVVFPEPLSPTTPRVCPRRNRKLTPSTALT